MLESSAMDELVRVPVSPRHTVVLRDDYAAMIRRPPRSDFVVSTLAKRMAGELPLMTADLVIAGEATRAEFPLAATYPLHFRKTYFPGRLHGDPAVEFAIQARASELVPVPMPIGHTPRTFRSCLIPGRPFSRLSPFGSEPEGSNLPKAERLALESAAGLFRLAEDAYRLLGTLHAGGLAHGDAELHNFIVAPSPLEVLPIDFEAGVRRDDLDDAAWAARVAEDLRPLLRHAVFLLTALGPQPGSALADAALARLDALFKEPERFRNAIERQGEMG